MKASWLACVLLSAGITFATNAPAKLAEDIGALAAKLQEVLKGIKDEKTARAALPALDELARTEAKLSKALFALSPEQRKTAALSDKAGAAANAAMKEFARIARLPKAYAAIKTNVYIMGLRKAGEARAAIQARALATKTEIYYLNNGEYPKSIDALTKKQSGGGDPLLPEDALLDPWGAKFKLSIEVDGGGVERVVVSTATPDGKKISNLPPKE